MVKEMVLEQFLQKLSSRDPVPGGGGASAVSGAYGASLSLMVISLTLGKKKYADFEEELISIRDRLTSLREEFLLLSDRDEEVFLPLMQAYAMPKSNASERKIREKALELTLLGAAKVPLQVMEKAIEGLELTCRVAEIGSKNAISDAGVAADFFRTALSGASLNVRINLRSMKESGEKSELEELSGKFMERGITLYGQAEKTVIDRIEE